MLVGLSCDSLGACLDSLGRSSAPLRLCWTLLEVSCGSLRIPWPPLGPSWAPLGLLLGSPGPLWAPSWALLGFSWASLGSLLGVPRTSPKNDPLLDASWLVFMGFWAPILDPILGPFLDPVLDPFFDVFFVVVLDPLQAQRPPKEGPSEDQTHLQGTFLLLFTRVLACRYFNCFQAPWCPLAASWCQLGPVRSRLNAILEPKRGPKMASETIPF